MSTEAPFGSWPSPITADLIVQASVGLGEVASGDEDIWWSELRPQEAGRVQIVRHRPDGGASDVLPDGFSARTRAHEYGGGAWWLHDDVLFFANWADQRLYRLDPGPDASPRALTPEPDVPQGARYADGRVVPSSRWVICVRELHQEGREAVNELVAIDAHRGGDPLVLVSGADFVSFPRISADGLHLCWTQWNHPNMPWENSELWVGELDDDREHATITLSSARCVSGAAATGEPRESIFQPEWTERGDLVFVSDRSGWWNLYRITRADLEACLLGGGSDTRPAVAALAPAACDIGMPQWVFAMSRYAMTANGIVCAFTSDGVDHAGVITDGALTPIRSRFTSITSVHSFGRGVAFIGASPTTEPEVIVAGSVPGEELPEASIIRPARDLGIGVEWFSVPEAIEFPTPDDDTGITTAHALFYPPTNPDVAGPAGGSPPLLVMSHGGPTSAARPQLQLAIQYWTSRGIAVVDVNYRGSTGYGRAYREALDGAWGIVDVDDCIAAARFLASEGKVDGTRLAIRGGSAGGFTTLCALTFHDDFTAGCSLYGVADLEALATDTHKFESRYLDSLVGPYPARRDLYVERSPIHHTDRLATPVIILQGLEDEVVPPSQAEMMVEALRAKGVPMAYVAFEGEQHGFRQAPNIKRALEAELYFYSRIFGFDLSDEIEPVPIENL